MDRSKWQLKLPQGGYPVIRVPLDAKRKTVKLINFSDLHWGHPNCRVDLIKRGVQWAKDNEALCIYGGDWIENNSKTSIGAGWAEQTMVPRDQIKGIVEVFEPIKEQFIGGITGNHESRTWNSMGHDPAHAICEKLDMPYFGTELYAVITTTDRAYTLYACHSGSGHKSSGMAAAKMQRDWQFVRADIKMKSHDHHLNYDTQPVLEFVPSHTYVKDKMEHLVMTGSTVGRPGSYATIAPLAPVRLGFMPVEINLEKRHDGIARTHWSVRPIYELAEG